VIASINLATGWDLTMEQALLIGERATNLARVYNVREGFSRKDDILPERLFQPLENGANAGGALNHEEFEQALTCIYELKGWDPYTSIPTRKKLEELSLGWAVDLLDKTIQ
jgi:aldehyde:ferredoxin oxidoreductase